MVVTNDVNLPQYKDLNVAEVNVSIVTLMAAAPYLGKICEPVNNEFMLCRQEMNDARPCLELGKRVTACAMRVFKDIKSNCLEEFKQYANCVDKSSSTYSYRHCRKTQAIFDNCMKDKMCVCRPDFGYFCRGRIHQTPNPSPPAPPCPCHPKMPEQTPSLPDSAPRPSARFNGRLYWVTE